MTIRAECAACGRDCANANATYNGNVYCIGCMPSLGPTGKFPYGMVAPDDDGAIRIAISKDRKGNVRLDFGGSCTWLAMPPNEAIALAKLILKHAEKT